MTSARILLAIVFGVLCMSTSSILIRFCSAPALIIAFYRLLMTSGLAAVGQSLSSSPKRERISGKDFCFILGSGLFLALHFSFWITSLQYTSVSSSVLFTNLQVIFVLVFSLVFLHEKSNMPVLAGILIALAGSALIATGDLRSGRFFGDMLALASGLFVSVYFLAGRYVRSRVETLSYTFLVSGAAALVLLIATLVGGLSLTGYRGLDWLLFFLMAVGPGLGGHMVLNWALKYVKAPIIAVSILGESVGASILAYFIFKEALLWYQLCGGALILLGIYLAVVNEGGAKPSLVD
ncbi:MAG TPA: DMT family transporter [Syntrophomonadaceae bacterium]|nr:DMT family transporter [Syntrophomonadaceae bacterium]